jgi:hexosaminidase
MKYLFFLLLTFCSIDSFAQPINIIPQPLEINQPEKGSYILKKKITLWNAFPANGKTNDALTGYLRDYLKKYYAIDVQVVSAKSKADIVLFPARMPTGGSLAYKLQISQNGVRIEANFEESAFHGIQSLIQLLPVENKETVSLPYVEIYDKPRFEYRGMHLDVARHFSSIEIVKRHIDFLAYHKLNVFHWHLTDDQGWRMEIKKYPELITIGSKRNGTIVGRYPGKGSDNKPYEGFYTQAEIKEVIAYAKSRFIEIIPEIEMPGHASAAIAAYPWLSCFPEKPTDIPTNMISAKSVQEQKDGRIKLIQETWGVFDDVFCAGKDSTFKFLENVLDEVMAIFPSKYVHIGGDECPKTHWKKCPACQKRMKEMKLKDEHELQSYFIQRIEKYVNSKGKTIIGWDEILEGGLAPNAQVMSWRGEEGGIAAAKQKHFVIMTPGHPLYFDHSQTRSEDSVTIGGFNAIEAVYAYDPIPAELTAEEGKYIRGAQANLWAEYVTNVNKIDYSVFPRIAALSEVLWTAKERKNKEDFERRLLEQFKRYDMWKANYSKAYFDLRTSIKPTDDNNGLLLTIASAAPNGLIHYAFHPSSLDLPYREPLVIKKSTSFSSRLYIDEKIFSATSQSFTFTKSTGKKISLTTQAAKNYPGDGAFTLVNGVVNEKGLGRSSEFLGFSGTDCEAVIDLGSEQTFSNITAHTFEQKGSWIWHASAMTVATSNDGINFTVVGETKQTVDNKISLDFASTAARYIKVTIQNHGVIDEGNEGAGHKAWLFVSEVQVR